MAAGTQGTLDERQEALRLLEQGRMEIGVEVQWLRARTNPQEILRHVIVRHPVLVLSGAFSAGLVPILLLFHRQHVRSLAVSKRVAAPTRQNFGGWRVGWLMRTLVPLLVLPFFEHSLQRRFRRKPQPSS